MSILGQTVTGIHLGLLLVNAATIALIFLLGRRLMSTTAATAAAVTYAGSFCEPVPAWIRGSRDAFRDAAGSRWDATLTQAIRPASWSGRRVARDLIRVIIRERIAFWHWPVNEAARGFLYCVWSSLSRLQ